MIYLNSGVNRNMKAKIDTKFDNGFLLSEEGLVKIIDIIKKRFDFLNSGFSIKYEIHRIDDALLTLDNVKDIFSEENSKIDKIIEINIISQIKNADLKLTFKKGEKTKLILTSNDKDLALLLIADLKAYLKSEVIVQRLSSIKNFMLSRYFTPSFSIILLLPLIFLMANIQQLENINIETASLEQKINYLVEDRREIGRLRKITNYVYSLPFIFIIGVLIVPLLKYFYPTDIFLWGKELTAYNSQKALSSKIFWGVIVAFIIAIGVALINKQLF